MRAGVDEHLVGPVLGVRAARRHVAVPRSDDLPHGQPVRLRELPVALVVCGNGHDRARPVAHQHVVGDPHRDPLAAHGVDDDAAGVHAGLGLVLRALLLGEGSGAPHVGQHLLLAVAAGDELRRRAGARGRATKKVAPYSVSGRVVKTGQVDLELGLVEAHLGSVRAADPVALHRQHALGPVLEQRHVVEQPVGVRRDAEVPLLERARLDEASAALAVPVDDLLVREHRLVDGAPLDRRVLLVREPALVQLQEDPLRPAVVLGLVRRELARPVDRPAHPLHLAADRGDVALGHLARVPALADRGVLGGQAERVVAHRVQHGEAGAPSLMAEHVAHRVVLDVPHVQLARRVGQHLQHVRARQVPLASDRPGSASRRRARTPTAAASAARSSAGRSAPPRLLSRTVGRAQKSLSWERRQFARQSFGARRKTERRSPQRPRV